MNKAYKNARTKPKITAMTRSFVVSDPLVEFIPSFIGTMEMFALKNFFPSPVSLTSIEKSAAALITAESFFSAPSLV